MRTGTKLSQPKVTAFVVRRANQRSRGVPKPTLITGCYFVLCCVAGCGTATPLPPPSQQGRPRDDQEPQVAATTRMPGVADADDPLAGTYSDQSAVRFVAYFHAFVVHRCTHRRAQGSSADPARRIRPVHPRHSCRIARSAGKGRRQRRRPAQSMFMTAPMPRRRRWRGCMKRE